MNERLILANLISFTAALMLSVSCVLKDREKIYMLQLFECVLLIFSQFLFGNAASSAVLALAAVRNFLLWKRKYTSSSAALVFSLAFVLGFGLSDSVISLLPVVATLFYNLSTYFLKSFSGVKISLFINLFLWIIYSFFILDISGVIINIISLVLNFISFFQYRKRADAR